jgi:alanine dehydrogenase
MGGEKMNELLPRAAPADVLVLSGADLARIVDRRALIAAMADAMRAYSAGAERALAPLRTVIRLPGGETRLLATMPGYVAAEGEALGAKLVSVYPGNPAIGLESHYGVVALFEPATGRPRAVLDGTFITTTRTAAVSAVSVEALARPDASVLAVIGAGVQARAHLWALAESRPWREARIASRTAAHAEALARTAAPLLPFPVRAVASAEAAVRGADTIVTATAAATPVLQRTWIAEGAHIVAVGSSTPEARELDTATIRDALVVVDSRTGALSEAGDLLIPMREGAITAEHIHAELGEVLAGTRPGRTTAARITLYKSLGLAVQDVAAAALFVRAAEAAGIGQRIRL